MKRVVGFLFLVSFCALISGAVSCGKASSNNASAPVSTPSPVSSKSATEAEKERYSAYFYERQDKQYGYFQGENDGGQMIRVKRGGDSGGKFSVTISFGLTKDAYVLEVRARKDGLSIGSRVWRGGWYIGDRKTLYLYQDFSGKGTIATLDFIGKDAFDNEPGEKLRIRFAADGIYTRVEDLYIPTEEPIFYMGLLNKSETLHFDKHYDPIGY